VNRSWMYVNQIFTDIEEGQLHIIMINKTPQSEKSL
jgi:hypothetical protein